MIDTDIKIWYNINIKGGCFMTKLYMYSYKNGVISKEVFDTEINFFVFLRKKAQKIVKSSMDKSPV